MQRLRHVVAAFIDAAVRQPDIDQRADQRLRQATAFKLRFQLGLQPRRLRALGTGQGERTDAELTDQRVERTAFGLRTATEVPVESRPGEVGTTVRSTVSEVHLPFFMQLHITYPDGLGHVMLKAITPVDDVRCTILQTVLRTGARGEILSLPARCGTRAIF